MDAVRERGLPIHAIHDPGDSLRSLVDRAVMLIDELGSEILHSSEFRTNVVALLCRRRRPGLRLVSTAHGWIANDLRGRVKTLLDRLLLRRFDRVILVSHAMRKRLPRWWVPDSRVVVIHNALMTESYGRSMDWSARRAPRPGEPVTLLSVGRLSREKGLDVLLKAVAAMVGEYPQLRLVIAGTGPLEGELRKLATRLRLTDKTSFIGYVTDMPGLYAEADLVVQSSLTEGLPNVMLEAAYLGVPVVATDVGGTREVIEHGINGWLVEPRSVAALVAGIRSYLEKPAAIIEAAAEGRRRIEADFSFGARTERQTSLYEELAGMAT